MTALEPVEPAPTVTSPSGPSAALPDPARDWDGFVATAPVGSYLQRSAWAKVKAVNGWRAARVIAPAEAAAEGAIGAQVLLRRASPLPWAFAYAARGPVAAAWTPDAVARFTEALRAARIGRVSHVRIDPEIEAGGPLDPDGATVRALETAGWRKAPAIQPSSTRVIDLVPDEAVLWSDLRKKWRQYVNKAKTSGVRVVEPEGDPIPAFYQIYRETADRAGFLIRTEQAYRDVWDAFRPTGDATMLFALDPDGIPDAALFLVRNGTRVVEPYGGMTAAGGDLRANYLLKWEAIRRSREAGATAYDLWGLAHPGIAHFKTGFGGREVRYIGAWDLVLSGVGRGVYGLAQRARVQLARRRAGLAAGGSAVEGTAHGGGRPGGGDGGDAE
jgi:peptidoglycan pentaglycine glycine transferase (the first glycine)